MNTPTPRTDAAAFCAGDVGDEVVRAATCREIENDLAISQIRSEDWRKTAADRERDLAAAHEELNTQAHELERLLNELAAAQERAQAAEARAEESARDAQRYRKCRRNGGFFFTSDCMTDDEVDAEIDALPDHAAIAEGKK